VEDEEREIFVREVIAHMDLPGFAEVWPETITQLEEPSQRAKLRKLLGEFQVNIIPDGDRGLKIYVDREVIAEWFKPQVRLRTDMSELRPSKRLFAELMLKYCSVFHEGEDHE
jgi:hypothetical protein